MNMAGDNPKVQATAGTYSIGEHLRVLGAIRAEDEPRILAEQRTTGLPFGEAAVRLGLIDRARLREALARQHAFHWPAPAQSLKPQVFMALRPNAPEAEAFRDLRTRLMTPWPSANAQGGARAIAVVSAERGDGRSFVAANLAVAFAQANLRTLLIDLDFRQPCLHDWFRRSRRHGVTGLLIGRSALDELLGKNTHQALSLIGAGPQPPNPQELLGPGLLGLLMATLRHRFDVIVADTPAWSQASDAQLAAAQCGQALLVTRPHTATLRATQSLVDCLKQAGVTMAGALVNRH